MDVIPIGFYRIIRVYHIVFHVAKAMVQASPILVGMLFPTLVTVFDGGNNYMTRIIATTEMLILDNVKYFTI